METGLKERGVLITEGTDFKVGRRWRPLFWYIMIVLKFVSSKIQYCHVQK